MLTKQAGPLPVGGWALLVGGAGIAAWMVTRSRTQTTTEVQQVAVPVGAIGSVDNAPLVTSNVYNFKVPLVSDLIAAITGNTDATVDNTGAVTGATAASSAVVAATPVSSGGPGYPGYASRYGSRGAVVSQIQSQLNARASSGLKVDGIFGPKTQGAVYNFQRARGLVVDGIVGPKTWGALFS